MCAAQKAVARERKARGVSEPGSCLQVQSKHERRQPRGTDTEGRGSETCKLHSMFKSQHTGHSFFRLTSTEFRSLVINAINRGAKLPDGPRGLSHDEKCGDPVPILRNIFE